jgi:hypothetical protein
MFKDHMLFKKSYDICCLKNYNIYIYLKYIIQLPIPFEGNLPPPKAPFKRPHPLQTGPGAIATVSQDLSNCGEPPHPKFVDVESLGR